MQLARRKGMRFYALAVFALLASSVSAQFAPGQFLKWSSYRSGAYSQIKRETTTVINNAAQFSTIWRELTGDPNAPSDVDFNKELLILVALGERSTGGYGVAIDSVDRKGPAEIVVSYAERLLSGSTTQAITSPYDIVRMDRAAGNIRFQKLPPVKNIPTGGGTGGFPGQLFYWRTYEADQECDIREPLTAVIADERDFDSYWRRLTGERQAPRDVNFSQELLVAIHLGSRASTGFDVLVESVQPVGNTIMVRYIEKAPANGQRVRHRRTSPYAIIRLPRYQNEIAFEKRIWNSEG